MRHVFVETNWVVDYASPSSHRLPEAVRLVERARTGAIVLHLPAVCLTEARAPIRKKEPRYEADPIRRFLRARRHLFSDADARATLAVLDRFEASVAKELKAVDQVIEGLVREPGLRLFGLNDRMLDRACELAAKDIHLKPFDQAILAAVLVRAEELADVSCNHVFCTRDYHLRKPELSKWYDAARVRPQEHYDIGE